MHPNTLRAHYQSCYRRPKGNRSALQLDAAAVFLGRILERNVAAHVDTGVVCPGCSETGGARDTSTVRCVAHGPHASQEGAVARRLGAAAGAVAAVVRVAARVELVLGDEAAAVGRGREAARYGRLARRAARGVAARSKVALLDGVDGGITGGRGRGTHDTADSEKEDGREEGAHAVRLEVGRCWWCFRLVGCGEGQHDIQCFYSSLLQC